MAMYLLLAFQPASSCPCWSIPSIIFLTQLPWGLDDTFWLWAVWNLAQKLQEIRQNSGEARELVDSATPRDIKIFWDIVGFLVTWKTKDSVTHQWCAQCTNPSQTPGWCHAHHRPTKRKKIDEVNTAHILPEGLQWSWTKSASSEVPSCR